MALVLVESLAHNKGRIVHIALKALEILVLSTGIISILLMLKVAVIRAFSRRTLVQLWKYSCNCFSSSPVCMAIAISFTVLLIAVSSRLHHHIVAEHDVDDEDIDRRINISKSSTPPEVNVMGKREQLTEEEDADTIEETWKAINAGAGKEKQKPKRDQQLMKKSETWDGFAPPRVTAAQRVDSEELFASSGSSYRAWKELRKSETFNDAMSIIRRGGLRRDPTTSLDELNNKVEAFIKKINDDMRLQRQESNQRVLDMINNRRQI